ncbi:hypothetical protein EV360DRAFT_90931 [Lentinula raphanica]|nr:hypothetical protein EV360DRAFT_90931 [Lentinula raphanica]
MKTGKKPWISARVNVISGPWKGYRGIVRDVDVYRLSPDQVSRGASGVRLLIELNVVTPTVTNPRFHIDYDHVQETSQARFLAHAIRPTERQSFFMPSSSYIPSKPEFTSSQHSQTVNASGILNGISTTNEVDPPFAHQPTISLVGIAIQVNLKGRKGTHYVKVMPRQAGGFMVIEERSKVGEPVVVWTPDVSRSQDRPKPKTEKSLMVIVKGPEEHIGKLVRRVHHFYKGTKSEDTLWFILGVVEFLAETGEILTSERLENHPDDLEKVQESRDV